MEVFILPNRGTELKPVAARRLQEQRKFLSFLTEGLN